MTRNDIRGRLYAIYAWLAGGTFTLLTSMIIVLLPTLALRRAGARLSAGTLLRLLGMRLNIIGLERLPAEGCIVVANHASYLDGIVLTAALPPRFSFVIKREITRVPLVALLLRRLGSQFVDRFDPRAGDAGRMVRRARNGTALGVFPEGTFGPEPGIRPFRLGAFLAASRGTLPVVPIGIQGTRAALPAGTWRPLPGRLTVRLGKSHLATARTRQAAAALADAAREEIAGLTGEPLHM